MIIFTVKEIWEPDVFGAVGVVAAAGAGPGGEGLVGAVHPARCGGYVC